MSNPSTHTSPATSKAGSPSSKTKGPRDVAKLVNAYLSGYRTLEQLAAGLTSTELQEAESIAANMAVRAAKASAYLMWRGGAGSGDHGHDDASKSASKAETKARRMIGFSYP